MVRRCSSELGGVIREKLASYMEQDQTAGRATDKVRHGEVGHGERLKLQNYCYAEAPSVCA